MPAYDIPGSGPRLILLPGIGGSAGDTWKALTAGLAATRTVLGEPADRRGESLGGRRGPVLDGEESGCLTVQGNQWSSARLGRPRVGRVPPAGVSEWLWRGVPVSCGGSV
ncbi:hypothetical protein [Streptomyces sp. NPDC002172]